MSLVLQWITSKGVEKAAIFDAIESEEPNFTAVPTSHPVEQLSDHVILSQTGIRFKAWVSDTPIREGLSHMGGVELEDTTINTSTGDAINVIAYSGIIERVRNIRTDLVQAQRDKAFFKVIGLSGTYENCILVSFADIRNKAESAISFDLQFTQIRVANSQIITVGNENSAQPRGSGFLNRGNQPLQQPNNIINEKALEKEGVL